MVVLRHKKGSSRNDVRKMQLPLHRESTHEGLQGGSELPALQRKTLDFQLNPHEEDAVLLIDVLIDVHDVPLMFEKEGGNCRYDARLIGAGDQQDSRRRIFRKSAQGPPENKKNARGGNRTPTGLPTGSLILRVYQFRHPSVTPAPEGSGEEGRIDNLKFALSQALCVERVEFLDPQTHRFRSRVRYWIASMTWTSRISRLPSRSARERETLRIRS